jgi:hypothetical protein
MEGVKGQAQGDPRLAVLEKAKGVSETLFSDCYLGDLIE